MHAKKTEKFPLIFMRWNVFTSFAKTENNWESYCLLHTTKTTPKNWECWHANKNWAIFKMNCFRLLLTLSLRNPSVNYLFEKIIFHSWCSKYLSRLKLLVHLSSRSNDESSWSSIKEVWPTIIAIIECWKL